MPDNKVTNVPAIKPPNAILSVDKPPIIKPTATPGNMAWEIASPIRLTRLKIRKIPSIGHMKDMPIHAISALSKNGFSVNMCKINAICMIYNI